MWLDDDDIMYGQGNNAQPVYKRNWDDHTIKREVRRLMRKAFYEK